MAKKKTTTRTNPPSGSKSFPPPPTQARVETSSASAGPGWFTVRWFRDTVESLVVAFVLAFLFRTFEAEAFVIPTGSMAPTLMGAHKDLYCPNCTFQYRVGASSEEDQFAEQQGRQANIRPVEWGTCPMCRFPAKVGAGSGHPTYSGDRILVSKFAYEFAEPDRWDVAVFKYPGGAELNYIKRLVALPHERVRLWHGDLYVRSEGQPEQIPPRPPDKLRAMAQIVYDNDYVDEHLTKAGWPLRWQAWPASDAAAKSSAWTSDDNGKTFHVSPGGDETRWLRYRHFTPGLNDWAYLQRGQMPPNASPRPRLITDFYAYNTAIPKEFNIEAPSVLGYHWVGDLMLECEIQSSDGKGQAHLDLVEGGRHFRCSIDLASGRAKLNIDGVPDYVRTAATNVSGTGAHQVIFANIDDQLSLWVDGSPVTFDGETRYQALDNDVPRSTPEDPLDLAPAGVGAQGGELAVRHLKLWRDIYYIATSTQFNSGSDPITDYTGQRSLLNMNYSQLLNFWSTPAEWAPPGGGGPFAQRHAVEFNLEADQFFMLGDNSPASADARLWSREQFVRRDLLIGKALMVFWPHSFNQVPGTSIPFPFFPNFARMGLIR